MLDEPLRERAEMFSRIKVAALAGTHVPPLLNAGASGRNQVRMLVAAEGAFAKVFV
jgi:hypothetical protein